MSKKHGDTRDDSPASEHQELVAARTRIAELARELDVERGLRIQLQESEAHLHGQTVRLACAIRGTGAGVVDWDIANDTMEFSDQWLKITGYSREDMRRTPFSSLIHPDDLASAGVDMDNVLAGRKAIHAAEYRIKHKNGHDWIWVLARSLVSARNEKNEPLRMVGTHVDISVSKRAEDARRESESRFRVLADGAPVVLFVDGPDGGVQFVNRTYCEYFGITAEEVEGGKWQPLLHPDDAAEYVDKFMSAVRTHVPFRAEMRVRRGDGEWRFAETIAEPRMSPAGEYLGHVGIVVDLTDRKLAEQERARLQDELLHSQKLESVGRLAGGVAHDFNNMLAVILGGVDLALRQVDSEGVRTRLIEVRDAAKRSADLTRQLLAFARKQPIVPQRLDINQRIAELLPIAGRLIGEHIALMWEPMPELWMVRMDPTQFDQLLTNVCVNARDSIDDVGTIQITSVNRTFDAKEAGIHPDCIPGDYVRIAIADDGCGMDDETQEHLFEPFYSTKGDAGTGLGLATVYGIIQQNRGFVLVTSALNSGTMFEIFFPRLLGAMPAAEVPVNVVSTRRANETILLVEDEQTLARTYSRMLEQEGYRVFTATTPKQAIQIAEQQAESIDLLLSDVIMPEMNGRDLATTLLGKLPGLKCVFMSGYTADIIADHGVLDAGLTFLEKPFSSEALAAKVRAVLDTDTILVS